MKLTRMVRGHLARLTDCSLHVIKCDLGQVNNANIAFATLPMG